MLCIQASFDQRNDDYDVEVVIFYQKLLKQFQIDNLTEKELMVFEQKGDEQDLLNMTWKYESCWALLWALGLIDELKFPNEPMTHDECHFAIEVVSNNANMDELLSKVKIRSLGEILDQADLIYRYHWACVDARINGKEINLDGSVVMERRAGLDWLFRADADWDYPDLNTEYKMMNCSELIKTLITDPIAVADELWVFKIEIFKSQKGYFATLWRLDSYNIAPTFPTVAGHIASETFFIDDSFRFDGLGLYGDDIKYFKTLDDCQSYVLKCIDDEFGV